VIVTFLLTRALPGDPAAYFADLPPPRRQSSRSRQARPRQAADLQFGRYVEDLMRGDLGTSLTTGQAVTTEIRNRLPAPPS